MPDTAAFIFAPPCDPSLVRFGFPQIVSSYRQVEPLQYLSRVMSSLDRENTSTNFLSWKVPNVLLAPNWKTEWPRDMDLRVTAVSWLNPGHHFKHERNTFDWQSKQWKENQEMLFFFSSTFNDPNWKKRVYQISIIAGGLPPKELLEMDRGKGKNLLNHNRSYLLRRASLSSSSSSSNRLLVAN